MTVDLVDFLRARLDDDALWATEASRERGAQPPQGGVHWHWVGNTSDEEIVPDPSREEVVGEEAEEEVSLRSREVWPTTTGMGDLPQFALYASEVYSAVGGHIARHDPARVLAEIDAKRELLARYEAMEADVLVMTGVASILSEYRRVILPQLALPYADHPDYREEWRP